ncbi:alanine racemase [Polycladidibacter hongkongensis]|uniref:alanine racemase n=1 Tax=Polycladidibacter hongkongensis TaxID=1647556 RepID=UPI000A445703|nr:alanine racemase [Pseudovibrio hongkongensis]
MIGQKLAQLRTPIAVIDAEVMENNITRVQSYMDRIGRRFRPHIKTHKIPAVAAKQIAAGAVGINCQKVSEAQVFADAGFDDILLTYNVLGAEALADLVRLNAQISGLSVTCDNAVVLAGLQQTFEQEASLCVLVECDTGGARAGVQSPQEARELVQQIQNAPGLRFGGLMTYPPAYSEGSVDAFFLECLELLRQEGIENVPVTVGGTPSLFEAHKLTCATEHRAGTYIYNDRKMVEMGHADIKDCAMRVLARVVSRPTAERVVIDAGSKALTSDLLGFEDYGLVVGYEGARVHSLSEEHGVIDMGACAQRPEIGDVLEIIPNHTCVISNLFDQMVFHREGVVSAVEPVAARGKVW